MTSTTSVCVFCDGRVEAGDGVWADRQGSHSPAVIVQDWKVFGKIILCRSSLEKCHKNKQVKMSGGTVVCCVVNVNSLFIYNSSAVKTILYDALNEHLKPELSMNLLNLTVKNRHGNPEKHVILSAMFT